MTVRGPGPAHTHSERVTTTVQEIKMLFARLQPRAYALGALNFFE